MPTDPDQRASNEVGLEAMGYLREANLLLAPAYEHAANNVADTSREGSREYRLALAKAWADAEIEFRRACMTIAPTIDASLRLVDIESIGERFLTFTAWSEHGSVSIAEVQTFDQHIHELFEELQRQWPELEKQPPLATFGTDDRALGPTWRFQLEQRTLWTLLGFALVIYVIGSIFWMVLKALL